MNVVIVEDESKSAKELVNILAEIDPHIKVLSICESIKEGMEWFGGHPDPDLVFSDIQLADGSSFEIYTRLNLSSPIIFFTAFDNYLLNAFETNGIGYLLKPIVMEDVKKALDKYHRLHDRKSPPGQAQAIGNIYQQMRRTYKSSLLVYRGEHIIPLPVSEISFIYSTNAMTVIYTSSNQRYDIKSTIDNLESQLDTQQFFRANRQFLIQRRSVTAVERFFARKLTVKLSVAAPEIILISKARAGEFLRWLEGMS